MQPNHPCNLPKTVSVKQRSISLSTVEYLLVTLLILISAIGIYKQFDLGKKAFSAAEFRLDELSSDFKNTNVSER